MPGLFRFFWLLIIILNFVSISVCSAARIKDIASIKGIRPNQLIGYGLVVGLNGSGDKGGTSFTIQGLVNMLEQFGVHVSAGQVKVKNVAAVMVNATLPPFARTGKRIDVLVSSIGDASSLQGGTLLLTPLKGVDGKIYALAQGAISIGGFSVGGAAGGGAVKNHPTVGRISGGGTVEKEVPLSLNDKRELTVLLNEPDFVTSRRVAEAINTRFGRGIAEALDSGTLKVAIPDESRGEVVKIVAELEKIQVQPDRVAKVIVNERTGTVVIGENVRMSSVAIAHGNLTIQVKEKMNVSQPRPFAPAPPGGAAGPVRTEEGVVVAPGGSTIVTPESDVTVQEEAAELVIVPRVGTLQKLVRALNAIGVTPRDLITILQTMKAAGALQAELQII